MLSSQLTPIFTTDFVRKLWQIEFRGSTIELAIDIGKVVSKRLDDIIVDEDICEVKLELINGNPSHLLSLARILSRKVRLHPGIVSKAEKGYRLFQNIALTPIKPSNLSIDGTADPIETFKTICYACLYHLQQNELGLLKDEDDEYIHQVRVATRRIRSAIKFFSSVLPPSFVETWNETWKDLANSLGDAKKLGCIYF
jgi:inorganic triphosphatase YgiF